jgi:imidazole glycerol phosphate synthase subunit HisF
VAQTIRRSIVLREYDIKETPEGRQTVFSVRFIKKNGESVFMPIAVACGLTANMKTNRIRGFLPIDAQGNAIGHPTPVSIDAIVEWNGLRVKL